MLRRAANSAKPEGEAAALVVEKRWSVTLVCPSALRPPLLRPIGQAFRTNQGVLYAQQPYDSRFCRHERACRYCSACFLVCRGATSLRKEREQVLHLLPCPAG